MGTVAMSVLGSGTEKKVFIKSIFPHVFLRARSKKPSSSPVGWVLLGEGNGY